MTLTPRHLASLFLLSALAGPGALRAGDEPAATHEFEIRNDRAYLGGHEVDLRGLRCGNALYSEAVTERHIGNLDNMVAHGINLLGVYIQGITNLSGSAPHAEMGGYGTGSDDRGVRFYYEWVRDHVGRWEYPRHVPVAAAE